MGEIKSLLSELFKEVIADYGLVIGCLVIGIIVGWYFKFLISDRKYNEQINLRFAEKDQRISELNLIVLERLSKVQVVKQDKRFFKKLKKYFKVFGLKK